MVSVLLAAGLADVNEPLRGNETPLERACALNDFALCHLLLEQGANPSLGVPLHKLANSRGDVRIAELVLSKGSLPLVEVMSLSGHTPLYEAALYGHHAMVRFLLKHGADPRKQMIPSGNTALHAVAFSAVHRGYRALFSLLNSGADIDAVSHNGYTPLHAAAFGGSLDCCRVLVELGANLKLQSDSGIFPEDVAASDEIKDFISRARPQGSLDSKVAPRLTRRRHSTSSVDNATGLSLFPETEGSRKGSLRIRRVSRPRSMSTPYLVPLSQRSPQAQSLSTFRPVKSVSGAGKKGLQKG